MSTWGTASQPVRVHLAVDGGGTKTQAVIVDGAGRVLGRGSAGSSNHRAEGISRALAHLDGAIEAAVREAGVTPPFARAWFGLAGIDRPEDLCLFQEQLTPLAARVHVSNDAELVLAGLAARPGVGLIAGTGSIALGIDQAGQVVRVGGWGHLIGDEGSGYDLGLRALRRATWMADGRAVCGPFLDLVLAHFGVVAADDLIACVYSQSSKAAVAALAPLILRAAQAGDSDARAIARPAAGALADAVVTVAHRLHTVGGPVALALGGSLLVRDGYYRTMVLRRVRRQIALGSVCLVAEPAVTAAYSLARDDAPDSQPQVASLPLAAPNLD